MLPGNHDLNIVDRSNPARMDLPFSPNRRLRELRTMSAMDAVQGTRVRVVDRTRRRLGKTLAEAIAPHREKIVKFADAARPYFSTELPDLWAKIFPMVVPPDQPEGLGIILFNSNADTHFSFTNALGVISAEQIEAFNIVQEQYPEACWLIGLHHHLMEYPWAVKALSERIGTALINGNWVLRQLKPLAGYAIFMHGAPTHRLDGRVRRISHHLCPLPGDGRDRRRRHCLLYPHLGDRGGCRLTPASA
jgi:hypothetical protein